MTISALASSVRTPSGNSNAVTGTVITAGRVTARLDALRSISSTLSSTGNACFDMIGQCATIEWNLPLRGDLLSPATSASCTAKLATLTMLQPNSLLEVALRAWTLSAIVSACVNAYEYAESHSSVLVASAQQAYDAVKLSMALSQIINRVQQGQSGSDAATEVMIAMPEIADAATRLVDSVIPGRYTDNMAMIAMASRLVAGPGPVKVSPVTQPDAMRQAKPVRSVQETFTQTAKLYDGPADVGRIQVQRNVDPTTGKGAWVVMVPGTKGGFGGSQPLDWLSNTELAGAVDSDSSRAAESALTQAMRREGVENAGEPVMLVGHSQGGLVATHLAMKHAKSSKFNITHVQTIGSPVGQSTTPAKVRALNVEQKQDLIPRLDAYATGQHEPNRVRVQLNDPNAVYNKHGKADKMEAHDADQYARDYAAWRERDHSAPEVDAYERSASHFFAGDDTRTYLYDAQRQPGRGVPQPPEGMSIPGMVVAPHGR